LIRWIILGRGHVAGELLDRMSSPKPKTIKPSKVICFEGLLWAQLGSNQRPPDYEFLIGISTGLHRFVSSCTSLIYFTLYVKDYTDLHGFVEILAPKLAPNNN
jgi:hypothetical protein